MYLTLRGKPIETLMLELVDLIFTSQPITSIDVINEVTYDCIMCGMCSFDEDQIGRIMSGTMSVHIGININQHKVNNIKIIINTM